MRLAMYSLTILILLFFEPGYKKLVGATYEFEINLAPSLVEWEEDEPYERVETSEPMDVPLPYNVIPTPVAFDWSYTDSFYKGKDYQAVWQNEINPTAAIHAMHQSSFHHVIHKRQDPTGDPEFSGEGPDCPALTDLASGNRVDDPSCTDYNSNWCTSTFSCNNGYALAGQSQLTCTPADDRSDWSSAQPTCNRIICGQLNAPANGNVDPVCLFESCKAAFRCNSGYNLNGPKILTCQGNGAWNGDTPTCQIRDCGDPEVDGGTFTGTPTTYGSTVTIQCNQNYVLSGNAQVTCQASGQWTQLPTCTYHCGDPPQVAHATVAFDCDTHNCLAKVTCDDGFRIEGSNLLCVRDQGWYYEPYCRAPANEGGIQISITFVGSGFTIRQIRIAIIQALIVYYRSTMNTINNLFGNFFRVVILSVSQRPFIGNINRGGNNNNGRGKRQLQGDDLVQVNYSVILDPAVTSQAEFAKAQADLIRDRNIRLLGKTIPILRTSLYNFTYLRNDSADVERLREISCEIFEYSINGCPAGTTCQVDISGDTTVCEPLEKEDDFGWKLGLGVGIPLFLLACAVLGCCIYYIILARRRSRRRKSPVRREYESSDSGTMSGFSPTMIPTRFNTTGRGGPIYGSYFQEAWEGPESVVEYEGTPKIHRRSLAPYVVTVGYEEQENFPSNFSWDFMYPHVTEDFSLPRPRV